MRIIFVLAAAVVGAILAVTTALGGDDNVPPISDVVVQEECSACHFAFQPAFLPAESWSKMMGNLEDHFGEDASLSETVRSNIEAYLVANAGRGNVDPENPPLRITELRWFKSEHSEREAQRMMERLNVKSLLSCGACHQGAEQGIYDDD